MVKIIRTQSIIYVLSTIGESSQLLQKQLNKGPRTGLERNKHQWVNVVASFRILHNSGPVQHSIIHMTSESSGTPHKQSQIAFCNAWMIKLRYYGGAQPQQEDIELLP